MKAIEAKNVDEYIALQPVEIRGTLEKLRDTIKKAAPKAEEVISYKMPAYKFHGVLVYFGAYQNHIGFYPTGSGISAFKKSFRFMKDRRERCASQSISLCYLR